MGSTKISAPPPRDIGKETRETLQAQVDLAPDLFRSEATFRPLYNELEQRELERVLPRQMALYRDQVYPMLSEIERASYDSQREGDISALEKYSGRATAAHREANKETYALLDQLNASAQQELALGARMDPGMRREVAQGIRAAQSDRGLGYGNTDVFYEALAQGQAAEQLRQNRRAFAANVIGLNQQVGADAAMLVLGRPSQMIGQGQGFGAQAMAQNASTGARLFNPESQYASQLYSQNYSTAYDAAKSNAAAKNAMTGAIIGAVGNIAGGAMKMCWVARAAFGADSTEWIRFFLWKELDAPGWFRRFYNAHGEVIADGINALPILKPILRPILRLLSRKVSHGR